MEGRFELVRSTSFGRKRVALPSACIYFGDSLEKPLKRQCSLESFSSAVKSQSQLEDLPQEILIRIVCGVDHDDLKQLLLVSKAMKEATLIAKLSHFAYSTPRKTLKLPEADDEAPNAPRQLRLPRSSLNPKERSSVSVALFAEAVNDDCCLDDPMDSCGFTGL